MWRFPNLAEPAILSSSGAYFHTSVFQNTLWGTPKDVSGFQCCYITVLILNGLIASGGILQTKSLPCGDLQHMTQRV